MLLVLGENTAFYASMVISRFFILDFLQLTFHEGVIPLLKLVKELVGKLDPDVYTKIEFLDVREKMTTGSYLLRGSSTHLVLPQLREVLSSDTSL